MKKVERACAEDFVLVADDHVAGSPDLNDFDLGNEPLQLANAVVADDVLSWPRTSRVGW